MFDLMGTVFANSEASSVSLESFLIASAVSLVLGCVIGLMSQFKSDRSKSFAMAVALMPIIVQTVILMVNGNLGVGVAVLGAFSLIRFRSMPGSASDIVVVFEAMAAGLACGTGFIGVAFLLVLIVSIFQVIYALSPYGQLERLNIQKELKITVPEDFDYEHLFDDTLGKFSEWELVSVKTTNMGSLYQLTYHITLRKDASTKELIDSVRTLNGNLKVSLGPVPTEKIRL